MFNTRQSSSFDGIAVHARNERPLTIALATIVMVWSFAFALTFATGHARAPSASWLAGAAAVMSSTSK
ncbi:MAG: hypothetical protein WB647_12925 [Roseiarcus sp.]|uniref:hypothetical protein n=1 Tax=Roseiarcus sp. TaxID=1969460 RepID=UPI003C5EC678